MRTRSLMLLGLVLASMAAVPGRAGAEANGGADASLVIGDGPTLVVPRPKGWVADELSGAGDGLPVVLYPRGGSWQGSPAAIYLRTFERHKRTTLAGFVRDDVARFRARFPRGRVHETEALASDGAGRALVREFSRDRWGNLETVAYLESPKGFVTVVLTARDRSSYVSSSPAYHELVRGLRVADSDRALAPFVSAFRTAERNGATAEGEGFDERIGEELARKEAETLRTCAADLDGGERARFDLLLRLSEDGTVEDVLARPGVEMADCLRDSLLKSRFSRPPRPAYWVRVSMSVSD